HLARRVAAHELRHERGRVARRVLLEMRDRVVVIDGLGSVALAQMIDGDVHDDPVEPGVDAGRPLEAVEGAVRAKEGVLHDVEGGVAIVDHAEGERVGATAVALEYLTEGVLIALPAALHELFVRRIIFLTGDRRFGAQGIHPDQQWPRSGLYAAPSLRQRAPSVQAPPAALGLGGRPYSKMSAAATPGSRGRRLAGRRRRGARLATSP